MSGRADNHSCVSKTCQVCLEYSHLIDYKGDMRCEVVDRGTANLCSILARVPDSQRGPRSLPVKLLSISLGNMQSLSN